MQVVQWLVHRESRRRAAQVIALRTAVWISRDEIVGFLEYRASLAASVAILSNCVGTPQVRTDEPERFRRTTIQRSKADVHKCILAVMWMSAGTGQSTWSCTTGPSAYRSVPQPQRLPTPACEMRTYMAVHFLQPALHALMAVCARTWMKEFRMLIACRHHKCHAKLSVGMASSCHAPVSAAVKAIG